VNIVPVIDLIDGHVVHARHGDRLHYQPIRSALCSSSAPDDIIASLLRLYPFEQLYIADINAIQGKKNHIEAIKNIRMQYPHIEIWLDAGINQSDIAASYLAMGVLPVIGSESIANIADYHAIFHRLAHHHALSLDWRDKDFLGPAQLLEDTKCWPEYIIAMTLNRVGSGSGPDFERLQQLQDKHSKVYAAGGIRNVEDLKVLAVKGIAGALVASALHSGILTDTQIDQVMRM
jgi:phosphoribosylformimino-5-aminoimidazole carboxamide ribotide isomerase